MPDEKQAMSDGWYWYEEVNGDREVIQVKGGAIYRAGSDVAVRLKTWPDRGEFETLEGLILWRVDADPEIKRIHGEFPGVADEIHIGFCQWAVRVRLPHGHGFDDAPIEVSHGHGWIAWPNDSVSGAQGKSK